MDISGCPRKRINTAKNMEVEIACTHKEESNEENSGYEQCLIRSID